MPTYTTINVGSAPNDGTGDPGRTAFQSVNSNFALAQAGGSNTHVQYNNGTTWAGDAGFTYTTATRTITLGDGTAAGKINPPQPAGVSTGYTLTIASGKGGSTSGNGGQLILNGADAVSSGTGGQLNLGAGAGAGSGAGGKVIVNTGTGGLTGAGGEFQFNTGNAGSSGNGAGGQFTANIGAGKGSGAGGDFLVNAGSGGATGRGGNVSIAGGPSTAAAAGTVTLTGGSAITSGRGGDIFLYAGSTPSGSGGNIDLWPGAGTVSPTNDGLIRLQYGAGPSSAVEVDGNGYVKFFQRTGFNGTAPIAKPTVTGSRGGNAALASLLTALANYGLITDSTTA